MPFISKWPHYVMYWLWYYTGLYGMTAFREKLISWVKCSPASLVPCWTWETFPPLSTEPCLVCGVPWSRASPWTAPHHSQCFLEDHLSKLELFTSPRSSVQVSYLLHLWLIGPIYICVQKTRLSIRSPTRSQINSLKIISFQNKTPN